MAQRSPGGGRTGRARLGGGSIATLIGVGLLVIFIVQNTERIRFHFLIWHFSWPLWIYTLVIAVVGAVVWFGLGVVRRHRRRRERRQARRG